MNTYDLNMRQAKKHLTDAHKQLLVALEYTDSAMWGEEIEDCHYATRCAKEHFLRAKALARAARACKIRAMTGGSPDQPFRL